MNTKELTTIAHCISMAYNGKAEDTLSFMEGTITTALDSLSKLVRMESFNLDDNLRLILQLKEMIYLAPQSRIHTYDAMEVNEIFEVEIWKLYRILSWPRQNTENSIALEWTIIKLYHLRTAVENENNDENLKRLLMDTQKIRGLMCICRNLIRSGSDRIRSQIYYSADSLATTMAQANLIKESIPILRLILDTLYFSSNNIWITQYPDRLYFAKNSLELAERITDSR